MAEKLLGPVVRDPRRRARPRLPAPRERARAVARARPRVRADLDAQRDARASPARRCRSRSATSSTLHEALDEWGREALLVFFLTAHWRKPDRLLRGDDGRGDGACRGAPRTSSATRRDAAPEGAWERFAAALEDDFNTPDALARHARVARPRPAPPRASMSSGSRRSRSRTRRPTEAARARASSARQARAARDFAEADRLRAEIDGRGLGGAGRARRVPARAGPVTPRASWSTAAGPCARRCAGRARCSSCGRPSARSPPSPGSGRRRCARTRSRSASSPRRRARATTRASSPGASRTATPTPYELAAAERPLLACLDQVTDPRNLGAVCRSAEGAGATGVVVPAHGSARVTAAVCRASAGAVEHLPVAVVAEPRALPRRGQGRRPLGLCGGGRRRAAALGGRSRRRRRARLRRRGQGLRPLVRTCCDGAVSIPLAGARRVAERERRGGAAALRGAAARGRGRRCSSRCRDPTLYLFDGYNLLHAGRLRRPARARRRARELRRAARRARRGRLRRGRRGRRARAARGPLRAARRRAARAARRRAPRHGASSASSRRTRVRGTAGQEVRKRSLAGVPARAPAGRSTRSAPGSQLGDAVDAETRARLERLRRGQLSGHEHTVLATAVPCKGVVTLRATAMFRLNFRVRLRVEPRDGRLSPVSRKSREIAMAASDCAPQRRPRRRLNESLRICSS